MTADLTRTQRACLESIARDGSAHGFTSRTVDSLRLHGLIELVTPSKPHPSGARAAFWRLTITAEQVGSCEGCSEPIYDGQPHGRDRETGDLWHVACRAEGSDDLD